MRAAAERLATELQGKLLVPDIGDATFESAVVEARVDGHALRIDFLTNVLGVRPDKLESSVVEILVPCKRGEEELTAVIPLMHPFHCLQSRVANVVKLERYNDVSLRQLEASPVIVREYINEALNTGDDKEATRTIQRLYEYLRSDIYGRVAHTVMKRDPFDIIKKFATDTRFDERFRELSMQSMIADITARREARDRTKDVLARRSGQ